MVIALCLRYWLQRYGESLRVGTQYYRGFFFQPPSGLLRWLYTAEQLGALARPLWAMVFEPSVNFAVGSEIIWRAQPYTVLKVLEFRHDSTPIYRMALLEPSSVAPPSGQSQE
ncbi:MAG: hypothetical protein SNJ72_09390 [Fimbriimonadales bacterium]